MLLLAMHAANSWESFSLGIEKSVDLGDQQRLRVEGSAAAAAEFQTEGWPRDLLVIACKLFPP